MNENINLCEILKDCPQGTVFYSSVYGELVYSHMYISSSASRIYFTYLNCNSMVDGEPIKVEYCINGRIHYTQGECTLFPSKDQKDWSKWVCPKPKNPKFDPKTLQPFDKILVRNNQNKTWRCNFFSHISKLIYYPYSTIDNSYRYCIPYNDDTKHLVGTTNEAPEYYRFGRIEL